MAQKEEAKDDGMVQYINGVKACGPKCNVVHRDDAVCLVCGWSWGGGYHNNGHTCLTGPNPGKRGAFPV